jgi:hypothetical protein
MKSIFVLSIARSYIFSRTVQDYNRDHTNVGTASSSGGAVSFAELPFSCNEKTPDMKNTKARNS